MKVHSFMLFHRTVLIALVLSWGFASTTATASQGNDGPKKDYWIYCTTVTSRTDRVVSPIVKYSSSDDLGSVLARFKSAFKLHSGVRSECGIIAADAGYPDYHRPGARVNVGTLADPVIQSVRLLDLPDRWYDDRVHAVEGADSKSTGGHIIIEDTKPTQASSAELAQMRLKGQRDHAEKMAKVAAESAFRNAELQAKIRKFFEEAKRRGAAQ